MKGSTYPYITLLKQLFHNKGSFFISLVLALVLFIGISAPAHAIFGISFESLGEKAAAGLISGLLGGLLYILNGIGVLLYSLASMILTTSMGFVLSVPYTPVHDNALSGITVGWGIMRDFANMFFVLILITIGVGTMLSIDVRGRKLGASLLIPFVIIAVLINFTPVLTGIVIDISNILTKFFFEEALGGVGALNTTNPFTPNGDLKPPVFTGTLPTALSYAFELSIALIFNLVGSLVLITMTFLLIARVLALWLLVIFSPLAFLAYILPQTRSYFEMWWGQFLQWAILPIPLGLFLLLSSTIVSGGAISCNEGPEIAELTGGASFCSAITALMALGTILVGMFVSFSTSAKGSGFIINKAQGAKQGSINWANQRRLAAQGVAGRSVKRTSMEGVRIPRTQRRIPGVGAAGDWVSKGSGVPVVGGAIGATGASIQGAQNKMRKDDIDRAKKQLEGLTSKQKLERAKREKDPARLAYLIEDLAKEENDDLAKEITTNPAFEKQVRGLQEVAKTNTGIEKSLKDFSKKNVHLSDDIAKTVGKLQPSELKNLSREALSDDRVIEQLIRQNKVTSKGIQDIGQKPEKLDAFISSLKGLKSRSGLSDDMFEKFMDEHVSKGSETRDFNKTISAHPEMQALYNATDKKAKDSGIYGGDGSSSPPSGGGGTPPPSPAP